ncbi:MAG: excinuclease ABC subunit B [Bacteroidetes bacterium]|nr:MAG: excinuclease ABC subunit B [Bacteroidota bacterium]
MPKDFELISDFKPTGDQPTAIAQLSEGVLRGDKAQVLLGVTGSGKTFTIANMVAQVKKPVLVLSHNKTLAAQLYGEFKQFFPHNAVEYFVSYYDYYQPEAYLPVTDVYIEKDLSINDEIEKLRLSTSSTLLSGRRDVIVVSSVSCIYGIGNPEEFSDNTISLKEGERISRNLFLHKLVTSLYSRTELELTRGTFRVRGDSVDIFPAYADVAFRVLFWGDEVEALERIEPESGKRIEGLETITIYPANIFVTTKETLNGAIREIQDDLREQIDYFKEIGKHLEAKRLEDRVTYDLEMMKELGYCSGIENYSRYFDRRKPGSRPFCLIDYFPDDFLLVVDESHVTIPQIRAMFGGDRSRKQNLVEYGFRLPSALDNRPLKFDEFERIIPQTIYVSATPAEYELNHAEGIIVEQLIRPTGLPDPIIEVRPAENQIDDLLEEINQVVQKGERILVTTLTKRMAEELTKYLTNIRIKCQYIHSDVDTLDRIEIMQDLRKGKYDVLVGVNLLREGLDLPEVSLVAILDADKEGFLRSERSLTQTAGRAARNLNAKVIMYANTITGSMQRTIDETERRRAKQLAYNERHHITPQPIVKAVDSAMNTLTHGKPSSPDYEQQKETSLVADPVVRYMSKEELKKMLTHTKREMEKAAKALNFTEAARLRDEMFNLQTLLAKRSVKKS